MSLFKQLAILAGVGVIVAALVIVDPIGLFGEPAGDAASEAPESSAGEAVPVIVETVRYASAAALVEAVGTGDAISAVTLHPEAAGRVTEILFEAGQRVEQGDPLLRLDAEREELALELARVHLQDARQQLDRYERAAPSGAVSSSEVDTARTALSAARVEIAQAELALRNRTLVAPFDGVVGIPEVDVGDRVSETTPITTLDDRSVLLVDFEVPEAFAQGVRLGGEIDATTWALPGEAFTGTVDSTASRIDPDTRTLRVRARIPNPDDRLRTGMSFVIRLPLQGDRFPSIPSIAVQWDRKGAYVWRVTDGVAERVEVRVLKREDQWVLVDAPLAADDLVVVEGVQRMRPGIAVDVSMREKIAASQVSDGV
jgi:membrane fusion protein (multidrug efflux system)